MKKFIGLLGLLMAGGVSAPACETCAVYSPPELKNLLHSDVEHTFKLNWFTRFAKLDRRIDGSDESGSGGEEIDSFINQLSLEHQTTPRLKTQISVPILHRDFKARDDGRLVSDDESGLGDISLLAKYKIHEEEGAQGAHAFTLVGGLKTPTGDSDRLDAGGHGHMEAGHGAPEPGHGMAGHGHLASAISGHDVTLGSGSWDVFGGFNSEWNSGPWMADAMALYYLRTEGDFDYEFADDLYIGAHVGRTLVKREQAAIALRGGILGEFRDADEQDGREIDHTELDAWYFDLTATVAVKQWLFELGVDIPLDRDSGGATLVPESRWRFSAGFLF